jgi:hypothetical protein
MLWRVNLPHLASVSAALCETKPSVWVDHDFRRGKANWHAWKVVFWWDCGRFCRSSSSTVEFSFRSIETDVDSLVRRINRVMILAVPAYLWPPIRPYFLDGTVSYAIIPDRSGPSIRISAAWLGYTEWYAICLPYGSQRGQPYGRERESEVKT